MQLSAKHSPVPITIDVRLPELRGWAIIVLACLIREDDWRPLKASWWRGKVLAPSVRTFAAQLVE